MLYSPESKKLQTIRAEKYFKTPQFGPPMGPRHLHCRVCMAGSLYAPGYSRVIIIRDHKPDAISFCQPIKKIQILSISFDNVASEK